MNATQPKCSVTQMHSRMGCNRVAQICNLPYRRIAFCGARAGSTRQQVSSALPITNRRYSRLQICATIPGQPHAGRMNTLVDLWDRQLSVCRHRHANVGQTSLSAGSGDFPVARALGAADSKVRLTGRQECLPHNTIRRRTHDPER
jgi:hypothetical protein